jgi:hypothetical protein
VSNSSNQVVYDFIVQTVAVQGAARKTIVGDSDENNREHGAMIGVVPPGTPALTAVA